MAASGIIVNRNNFLQIGEEINFRTVQAVRETAEEVVSVAKSLAPVDTGALRESIHTVFPAVGPGGTSVSGFERATTEAQTLRPGAGLTAESTPVGPYEAAVGIGVDYWMFVEFGTRFMRARPFVTPAVEAARPGFERKMAEAVDRG